MGWTERNEGFPARGNGKESDLMVGQAQVQSRLELWEWREGSIILDPISLLSSGSKMGRVPLVELPRPVPGNQRKTRDKVSIHTYQMCKTQEF